MSGGDSTTTQKINQTASTKLPAWVNEGSKDIFSQAKSWLSGNQEYTPYAGDRTGEFGDGWAQASDWLKSMIGATDPDIAASRSALQGVMGTLDPNKTTQDYMNPHLAATLDPTLRAIQQGYDKNSASLGGSAAAAGAFGDSGHGVQQSLLARDKNNSIGDATAAGYSKAWDAASAERNSVLQRIMSGAQQMAALGGQQFSQNTTAANAAAGVGATEQGVNQKGIDSLIADNTKGQTWGMDQLSRLMAILSGAPTDKSVQTIGTNTTTSPDNSGMALAGSVLGSII